MLKIQLYSAKSALTVAQRLKIGHFGLQLLLLLLALLTVHFANAGIANCGFKSPRVTSLSLAQFTPAQSSMQHRQLRVTEAEIAAYENSCNTDLMLRFIRGRAGTWGVPNVCYRAVKQAVIAGKMVPDASTMPGIFAVDALQDLEDNGFINLLNDPQLKSKYEKPSDAPHGAILVYGPSENVENLGRGARASYSRGDIQIRSKFDPHGDTYYNDVIRPRAYTDQSYGGDYGKLIGVMVLPPNLLAECPQVRGRGR